MSLKYIYIILTIFLFVSCKKDFVSIESSKIAIDDFFVEEIDYKYLSTKSKFQYKNDNQLINATLYMRIERDSKIWVSVRVALGVEAARGLITKEEFIIIDRVNKHVIISTPDIIEREFKINLNFEQLESILTGNLLYEISDIKHSLILSLYLKVLFEYSAIIFKIFLDNFIIISSIVCC